jgi:hypothetical protein
MALYNFYALASLVLSLALALYTKAVIGPALQKWA